MEAAIVVALLVCGAVAGGLIVAAWMSDGPRDPFADIHSGPDDVERRARRVQ